MITTLLGVATLFSAGSLVAGGAATLGATPVRACGAEAALTQAGDCGSKEAKPDAKAGKAKDGSCGKGSCGGDMKGKKDGSCGKDKKAAAKKAAEKKETDKK